MKKQNRGFTLIELLVVIAVIGLLASIVLVAVNSARIKARDSKRMTDLKQISLALELYYDKYGNYPISTRACDGSAFDDSLAGGVWITGLNEFMTQIPIDPKNQSSDSCPETWDPGESVYMYRSDGQKFELLAPLEGADNQYRCDKNCWRSNLTYPGQSWCRGETNNCPNPAYPSDDRGQHMYVLTR